MEPLKDNAFLRSAQPGDESGIFHCIRELAIYEKEPDAVENSPEMIREALFGSSPTVFAFVVEKGEEIVGIAVYFLNYSTWTGKNGIWLEDLFVLPEHRGCGYGLALIKRLAQECCDRDYSRLEWTVLDWNEPAVNFYWSIGAQPMDQWTTQRLSGDALSTLAAS